MSLGRITPIASRLHMIGCVHQFHVCGFETVAVVCDGASSNMTMVKEMSGSKRGCINENLLMYTFFSVFLMVLKAFSPHSSLHTREN